jgi:tRNA(fMet)-specific endonuclease VapC
MLVLDTDHVSVLIRQGTEKAVRLNDRLAASGQEVLVTIISYEEQTRGWLGTFKGSLKVAELVERYRRLEQHLRFYSDVKLLSFDEVAATRFQALRKAHRRLTSPDLKIAAVVLVHDAVLLSRNLRDFKQIPGLKVEDWIS